MTVQVPLAAARPACSPTGSTGRCPGCATNWSTALIKSLPKAIRRQVVPAADWARRLLGELADTAGMRAQDGERPPHPCPTPSPP